jgi:transglutaminase-like putative cysteine protease
LRLNHFFLSAFILLFFLATSGFCAQTIAPTTYVPPTTLERNVETYAVQADGRYLQTVEVVFRVETLQGIEDAGTQQVSFISSNESIESIEAWTTQPDGTRITVPPDSIRTRDEDNSAGASQFSDSRIKAIIYPNVQVGSRVSYTVTSRVHTPPYPGEFNASFVFPASLRIEHWEFRVTLPTTRKLYIEMRGVTGGLVETVDGISHYHFQYQGKSPIAPEKNAVGSTDFADYLRVSTMPDMVALGARYQATAKPMATVTDAIRALAGKLTAGLTDDRDKARVLYHWVASNIRYVAVFLGNGRLVPHAADKVLANRYGDCKDHAVLLEALLAAVGIESSPALINSGTTYTLP